MRDHGHELPQRSPWLCGWFTRYAAYYLRRHVHAIRLSRAARIPELGERSAIFFANHAAWFDPLIALFAADRLYPGRPLYAPFDAAALARYPVLGRFGFFGVEQNSRRGAAQFLRAANAILDQSRNTIWLTPQGRFADVRERPVEFKAGLAHLAASRNDVVLIPAAAEYVFWEERTPEVLLRFGIPLHSSSARSADDWNENLQSALAATQDALAAEVISRDPLAFTNLLRGAAGVGGFYETWRRLRSKLRGQRFSPEHSQL